MHGYGTSLAVQLFAIDHRYMPFQLRSIVAVCLQTGERAIYGNVCNERLQSAGWWQAFPLLQQVQRGIRWMAFETMQQVAPRDYGQYPSLYPAWL